MRNWIQWPATAISPPTRLGFWLLCTVAITGASLTRANALPIISFLAEYVDKCLHFAMYLIYTLAWCWLRPRLTANWLVAAGIALFCTLYGFTMELLQGHLPSLARQFSLGDGLANGLGAVTGAWLWVRTPAPQAAHTPAPSLSS